MTYKDVNPAFEQDIKNYVFSCSHSEKATARYELGFVLGDFAENYQRNLFEQFRMLDEKNLIRILAKVAWRNENFIKNFPQDLLKKYFKIAIELIIREENRSLLMLAFEFVMVVFRLRENADEELSKYLSLNNPLIRALYTRLEKFIATNYFTEVNTRINFEDFEQSVEFKQYNIHDFFYALLVYITGERGESDIIISSVSN